MHDKAKDTSVSKGHEGTFDHEECESVPDDIIRRTLPFMPPTLRAMVVAQRLTGCRPSEIFNMKVGDIIQDACTNDAKRVNGLYVVGRAVSRF
jgi:integrase